MNATQFQELMKILTACLDCTTGQTVQQVIQFSINNVNLVSNFGSFDPDKEDFSHYKQRLENYLRLKNVFEDKNTCAKVLLHCMVQNIMNY